LVVSSVAPAAQALLSFHLLTGKLGSRPFNTDVIVSEVVRKFSPEDVACFIFILSFDGGYMGLDQGIGHLRPFRLTPALAAVDSAALAVR
jgi:hypothetical protein